jgi:hypothetical protein
MQLSFDRSIDDARTSWLLLLLLAAANRVYQQNGVAENFDS